MTLEKREMEISFAGGMDQKQQVELQSVDTMRDQLNVRFDELGACEKRVTAYSTFAALEETGGHMHTLIPRKDEVAMLSSSNGLYRYDNGYQGFREVKRDAGELYKSTPCEVSRAFTVDSTASRRATVIACAVRNGYVAVVYVDPDGVRVRVFEELTRQVAFESDTLTTYAGKQVRCITSEYTGKEGFFVFYETSATNIDVAWVDPATWTATSLGTIINDHDTTYDHQWDVVAETGNTNYRIVYNSTAGGGFGTLLGKRFSSNTLLSTHTATHSARYGCCIATDGSNYGIVSAHGDAGVPTLSVEPWGTPGSVTAIYTLTTTVSQAFNACFAAVDTRAGSGYAIVGAGVYQPTVLSPIKTNGCVALLVYLPNLALGAAYTTVIPSAMVAANAFTVNGRAYLPVALTRESGLQSLTPANVVLGFYEDSGSLRTYAVARYNHDARYTLSYGAGNTPASTTYVMINSPVVSADGTYVYVPGGGDDQERRVHKLDFDPPPLGRTEYREGAYVANGVLQHYDGAWITEQQWLGAPACALADGGAGGTFAAGTYLGTVYNRWVDAQGDLHRSTAAEVDSVTTGGANHYIELYVLKPPTAPRGYVQATDIGSALEIFLTSVGGATPAGVIFSYVAGDSWYARYRLTDVSATFYSPVGFGSDLYTYGGELESQPPPSFIDVQLVGDRMWGINAENRRQVWASKPCEPGYAVEWASELAITLAEEGELLRVFEVSGVTIVLSTTGLWEIRGAGPNKNNVGSFEPPRKIHRFKARGRASAALTPDGLAIGRVDGWCILGPDLSLRDIGTPIAPFLNKTNDDATAVRNDDARAVYHPDHRELRIIGSYSDDILVYNMLHGKWSRWTSPVFTSNRQNDGAFVAGRYWDMYSGVMYGEWSAALDSAPTTWMALVAMATQTPWVRVDGITGFGRVWKIVIAVRVLDAASFAGISVELQVDYGQSTKYFSWTAADIQSLLPSGYDSYVTHLVIHLPVQRIKAFRLRIEEQLDLTSEPSYQLLSARVIYGVRPGGAKMANDTQRRGPNVAS